MVSIYLDNTFETWISQVDPLLSFIGFVNNYKYYMKFSGDRSIIFFPISYSIDITCYAYHST